METALATQNNTAVSQQVSTHDLLKRMAGIQQAMQAVMKKDVHYGIIPGTRKNTLYKPGAEVLCLLFGLRTIVSREGDIEMIDLGEGHREFRVHCHILSSSGEELATGIGSCSTKESKYRWRSGYEVLDEPIPDDYKTKKSHYRRNGLGAKNENGNWVWVKYLDRQENPDIADTYNTVLKMAKKRSMVDGVLSATGASDMFEQDLDDEDIRRFAVDDADAPRREEPASRAEEVKKRIPGMTKAQEKEIRKLITDGSVTDEERGNIEEWLNGSHTKAAAAKVIGQVEEWISGREKDTEEEESIDEPEFLQEDYDEQE